MILKQTQIGNLITKISTWNPAKEKPNDILNYIDIGSVDKDEKKIVNYSSYLGINAPSRARQLVKENDVIVSTVRPNLNTIAQIPQELDGATASTGFCILRANPEKLHHRYLFHWVKTNNFITLMTNLAIGANYPAVSDSIIKTSQIPLPPLEEQKRIAHILDLAAGLQAKRRQTLARLDALLQSTFLEMFGDPVTNPKGWEVKELGEIVNFQTGKLNSNAAVENGIYPFFTCAQETMQINSYAFDCEALLLAGNNATADYSVKYYKGKFNAYQRTYIITLKPGINIPYNYLRMALTDKLIDLKNLSKGSNTRYLTLTILNNLKILIPSLELMNDFDKTHEKIFEQNCVLLKSQSHLDTLFASLQQRAFTGRL